MLVLFSTTTLCGDIAHTHTPYIQSMFDDRNTTKSNIDRYLYKYEKNQKVQQVFVRVFFLC